MNPCADTLIPCFRTPAVRDLAWACFSEPLFLCKCLPPGAGPLQNCTLQLTPERVQWLERLDREPAALLAQLQDTRKGRLGVYFEHLWHFFLRQDPAVDLLAHNLPVHDGTRTLGEFDCLYYCHQRQQYIHLELAVKFYLQAAPHDGSEWRHWVGPGLRDRLDIKMQRLLSHQVCLGDMPEAGEILQKLGIGKLQREMEMKGRLFQSVNTAAGPPPACNPRNPLCTHVSAGDITTLSERTTGGFKLLSREQWFAPVQIPADDQPYQQHRFLDELEGALDRHERPVLVAELDLEGREQRRLFVTPEHWPEAALCAT
jgi:uncharacterized protein